jgi:Polysaccharide lyase
MDAGATADGGTVLRLITGDQTVIAPDWTASEGGDTFDVVKDGSPLEPWISSAHFAGDHSLAFGVPSDMSGHKERVEYKVAQASDRDGLHFDNARYAGFAFKLGGDPAPFLDSAIFWQAWQGYPYGPPVSLKFEASAAPPYRIKLAIRNPSTGPSSTTPDIELWSASMIDPDTWHTFLIYVEPRFAGDGEIKMWIDGTRVLAWSGAIGYDPTDPSAPGAYAGLDIKDGIYQPDANNGHTFYFDQIVVATTYAAAANALGWPAP